MKKERGEGKKNEKSNPALGEKMIENGTIEFKGKKIRKIHLIGIGGAGMSALAELGLGLGLEITGSDLAAGPVVKRLTDKKIPIFIGHSKQNLGTSEAVVYSSAVNSKNPELREAELRGLPLLHRSDFLNLLMEKRTGVTVAGTHGKSTVTAMLATILCASGEDPLVAAGAEIPDLGGNFRLGRGNLFVAEADESDHSFLKYHPYAGIVTNIDADHLNNYRGIEEIKNAFLNHLDSISPEGAVVCCLDDPNLKEVSAKTDSRVITYGTSRDADYQAVEIIPESLSVSFNLLHQGEFLARIKIPMPGKMNAVNALGAISLALFLGINRSTAFSALEKFKGVSRRLEFKGRVGDIWIMDDYGHHPTEIQAALQAVGNLERRIVLVFQPHRYSRTSALLEELADAFSGADELILLPVYSAGEAGDNLDISRQLAHTTAVKRDLHFCESLDAAAALLEKTVRPGDLVLTMGAGDVWKIGEIFLEKKR